ncbi:MAG: RNA polymerase subunit sigma [Burkholderia gladioli]
MGSLDGSLPPVFFRHAACPLRASATLRVVLAAFVALCAAAGGAALQLADGQFAGKIGAVFVGLLTDASLAAVARETCARRIPAALRIEPATGMLAAYDHAGRCVAHGAVVRCMHWADRLLVLAIARERGAPVPLLVPADAVDAVAFRALSVLGRRAVRAGRG